MYHPTTLVEGNVYQLRQPCLEGLPGLPQRKGVGRWRGSASMTEVRVSNGTEHAGASSARLHGSCLLSATSPTERRTRWLSISIPRAGSSRPNLPRQSESLVSSAFFRCVAFESFGRSLVPSLPAENHESYQDTGASIPLEE